MLHLSMIIALSFITELPFKGTVSHRKSGSPLLYNTRRSLKQVFPWDFYDPTLNTKTELNASPEMQLFRWPREDLPCHFVRPSSIVMHSSNHLRTLYRRNFDIPPQTIFRFAQTVTSRQCDNSTLFSQGSLLNQSPLCVHVHAHATACKRSRRRWPTPKKSFPLTRQKVAQRIISQIRKLFVNNSIGRGRPEGISHARKELSRECFVFICRRPLLYSCLTSEFFVQTVMELPLITSWKFSLYSWHEIERSFRKKKGKSRTREIS